MGGVNAARRTSAYAEFQKPPVLAQESLRTSQKQGFIIFTDEPSGEPATDVTSRHSHAYTHYTCTRVLPLFPVPRARPAVIE